MLAAPIDDLKAIKPLPVPTYTWPVPARYVDVSDPDYAKTDHEWLRVLTEKIGSIGVLAEDPKARHAAALRIAQAAEAARGTPVTLAVTFRPWLVACDPLTDDCWSEFGRTYRNWNHVAEALAASSYRPPVVCLVDTETMVARDEPQRSKIAELYEAYDRFLRIVTRCSETDWYGWGATPALSLPDGWAIPPWSVPFAGQTNIGFQSYQQGEIHAAREASWRARAQADAAGISNIVAWIAAPGCGQVYDFSDKLSAWSRHPVQPIAYDAELGRELYGWWHRESARERRFFSPPSAIVIYPNPLDPRIIDPDRSRLIAFLNGATE